MQSAVRLRPLLVRPEQAALLLGTGEVVADFVGAGWLRPIICQHRLTLYGYRDLDHCVARLETGERPVAGAAARPKPASPTTQSAPLDASQSLSMANQLRGIVLLRPLLVRPEQAAVFIGSTELVDDFRKAGWLAPVYGQHRLTLYSVRHLEGCVARLEAGQRPDDQHQPELPPATVPKAARNPESINPRPARRTRRSPRVSIAD